MRPLALLVALALAGCAHRAPPPVAAVAANDAPRPTDVAAPVVPPELVPTIESLRDAVSEEAVRTLAEAGPRGREALLITLDDRRPSRVVDPQPAILRPLEPGTMGDAARWALELIEHVALDSDAEARAYLEAYRDEGEYAAHRTLLHANHDTPTVVSWLLEHDRPRALEDLRAELTRRMRSPADAVWLIRYLNDAGVLLDETIEATLVLHLDPNGPYNAALAAQHPRAGELAQAWIALAVRERDPFTISYLTAHGGAGLDEVGRALPRLSTEMRLHAIEALHTFDGIDPSRAANWEAAIAAALDDSSGFYGCFTMGDRIASSLEGALRDDADSTKICELTDANGRARRRAAVLAAIRTRFARQARTSPGTPAGPTVSRP